MGAGAPPHALWRSSDNGQNWTEESADSTNRPQNIIRDLFETSNDTEWIAVTGDVYGVQENGIYGGIYDGTDLDSDEDIDWVLNEDSETSFATMAAAEKDGVYVAFGSNGSIMKMFVSPDANYTPGDSWKAFRINDPLNGDPVDIIAIGNGFMAVTHMGGLVRGSADGTTWQVITDESWGSFGILFRP